MNKTIILDYSVWRSGGQGTSDYIETCTCDMCKEMREEGYHSVKGEITGIGNVRLYNNEGHMCILGQAILQIDRTISREDMRNACSPVSLHNTAGLVGSLIVEEDLGVVKALSHSEFANKAMDINDDRYLTTAKRIELLTKLFAENGYDLEVVNMPEPPAEDNTAEEHYVLDEVGVLA